MRKMTDKEHISITDKRQLFRYCAVEEHLCSPELGKYATYGLAVIDEHGGQTVATIHDVSSDGETVRRMAALFTERSLSPLHVHDVVEDMLP